MPRYGGGEDWRREGGDWRGRGSWREEDWRRDEGWRGRDARDWREEDWRRRGEPWRGRGGRPEIDPPWVERGPEQRARGESRGLVEWEDRGPLAWLGDRIRGERGRAGRGPKGYKRSDERIHDEVCERIARTGVDADEVEVKVEHGEVTLTGTVRDRMDKWHLEDVTDDVFGVDEVHNHLRVRRSEELYRPGGTPGGRDVRH